MANSLLTINMITQEAVRLWQNTNAFVAHIDRQYDDAFAKVGAKIGQTIRIRLPNDYTVRTGAALSVQDTAEQYTTLALSTQKGVDVSFSSLDRTLSLDDFSERVLAPMMNNLVGNVAADVMSGAEPGTARFTANQDASGNVLTPNAATWLSAGAILTQNSAPVGNRKLVLDPITMARTVSSLSGLLNPSNKIGPQYDTGQVKEALGFDWMEDQTIIKHTTAAYNAGANLIAGTVNGAAQTGLTITTNALSGPLAIGDIVTFDNCLAVNRITKVSTGQAQQFVVTAAAAANATSLSIYPAIVPQVLNGTNTPTGPAPAAGTYSQVQYQTVDSSPANSANINVVTVEGITYRKNLAFVPEAITLGTADLELPEGVHEAARAAFDGVSMRMISDYIPQTDQFVTRLDVIYGYLYIRPEWVVAVGDQI